MHSQLKKEGKGRGAEGTNGICGRGSGPDPELLIFLFLLLRDEKNRVRACKRARAANREEKRRKEKEEKEGEGDHPPPTPTEPTSAGENRKGAIKCQAMDTQLQFSLLYFICSVLLWIDR